MNTIIEKIKGGHGFSFARFNDGEMILCEKRDGVAARGDQKNSPSLRGCLMNALSFDHFDYHVGVPCSKCYPKHAEFARMVRGNRKHKNIMMATEMCNSRWKGFVEEFAELDHSSMCYVHGSDTHVHREIDINGKKIRFGHSMQCTAKNAWSVARDFTWMETLVESPAKTFLFAIGPAGSAIIPLLMSMRPDAQYIHIGSTLDPFVRNVWHRCHKGTLPPCPECNA